MNALINCRWETGERIVLPLLPRLAQPSPGSTAGRGSTGRHSSGPCMHNARVLRMVLSFSGRRSHICSVVV